jgi:hypothetical protein
MAASNARVWSHEAASYTLRIADYRIAAAITTKFSIFQENSCPRETRNGEDPRGAAADFDNS